jgi:D-glycero-D-manno-heptose 1,7-bisphosphate phosphatase
VAEELFPAVFLDRDGTLMRDAEHCAAPKDVEVFFGVSESLKKLKERGYKIIIITNQSGIGRGYFSEEDYRAVEKEVIRQIGPGLVDATYFCPHGPDQICGCRKPEPGMVSQAAYDHKVDLSRSFFIGDKDTDTRCGRKAGLTTILVHTGYGQYADQKAPDFVAQDFAAAASVILGNSNA